MSRAVLVMAYGTPGEGVDVETFYTDVRRGRPPSAEQLADLERRYAAIGGLSPLTSRTHAQIAALTRSLEAQAPGAFRTYYGTKHGEPRIESAVARAAAAGEEGLVGLVLAPHYSALSIGEYVERAAAACAASGLTCAFVEHWHTEPVLVELLAERVVAALATLELSADEVEVLVSAHSLPARVLEMGDPYPAQLAETADLVAEKAGITRYRTAWQSAGRTPEPWLGPTILEVIEELAASATGGVVVCPAGFTSDHLEILYDLDIEARALAERLGLRFARTASLNDEPALFEALATLVGARASALG